MVKDAESHAAEDKKRKALVEARNQADALVHSTEKALSEHGDKVDASEKSNIEAAIAAVKDVLTSEDVDQIQSKTQALAQASMKLGEAMYKASQAGPGEGGEAAGGTGEAKPDDNVVDAEFSEVDEDKKKGAA
jgi:molecular chaperone DnaK